MTDVVSASLGETQAILELTRALVAIESPSRHVDALERCAALLAAELGRAGADVRRLEAGPDAARHITATWAGDGPRVLLVGHFDTVWPIGQLAEQPLREQDGRLYGPGTFDMKAGLAIGVTAARVVASILPEARRPRITMLATSDEEVGSGTSRAHIEALARESDAVLVLEPATPSGAVKTSRKGVGEFEIVARGISAHAGVDPGAGASAVHELAHQVIALEALADPAHGLTLNVGVIDGGTRSNVVAEQARAVVDVRISRLEDASRIERTLRALRPRDGRVTLTIAGGVNRPPMERGPGVARLFAIAREVAAEIGWDLQEGSTGGGSDGNFSAALGVPTLDGLGATGDGAHARHEHIVINELAPRAALLAGLLARLGDNGVEEITNR